MMSYFSSCFEGMTGLLAQAPAEAAEAGSGIGLEHRDCWLGEWNGIRHRRNHDADGNHSTEHGNPIVYW